MLDWTNCAAVERVPGKVSGAWVFKGTRVPVTRVLAEVAAGTPFEEIQQQYDVTADDIRAAVAFANELVENQAFIPTSAARRET